MKYSLKLKNFRKSNNFKSNFLINLSVSLIKYEFLKLNIYKAKQLVIFLEPIINISKNFSSYNFRFLYNKLRNIDSIFKLFKVIGPRYIFKNGGYLKLYKQGFRKGDNSPLSILFFS